MFPPKFTHPPSLRTVIDPAEPTGSDRAVDDRAAKEHSLCTCNPSRVMSNMMASKKWNGEPMGQPIAAENAFLVGCWLLDLIGYWAHPQLVIGDHDKIIVHHGVLQRWWVYFCCFWWGWNGGFAEDGIRRSPKYMLLEHVPNNGG